jgi:hypothetical protein
MIRLFNNGVSSESLTFLSRTQARGLDIVLVAKNCRGSKNLWRMKDRIMTGSGRRKYYKKICHWLSWNLIRDSSLRSKSETTLAMAVAVPKVGAILYAMKHKKYHERWIVRDQKGSVCGLLLLPRNFYEELKKSKRNQDKRFPWQDRNWYHQTQGWSTVVMLMFPDHRWKSVSFISLSLYEVYIGKYRSFSSHFLFRACPAT